MKAYFKEGYESYRKIEYRRMENRRKEAKNHVLNISRTIF